MRAMSIDFPISIDLLTADWLTDTLRAGGTIGADTSVASISPSPLGEGMGMLSDISRVAVTYDGPNPGPSSIIAKFTTATEANRGVAMHFQMHMREVRFFRDIAPRLDIAVPAHYGAFVDEASCESVLLLEDLATYRAGDQVLGCDAAEAGRIIDEIVPLHAAFWGKVDDPALDWVMSVASDLQNGGISGGTQAGWEPMLSTFGHVVPESVREAGPRLLAGFSDAYRKLGDGVQTLVHGDVRLDNIMFGDGDSARPVLLIDWQGFMKTKGMQDVAYLLTQNLHTSDRRAHTDALLDRYLAGLAAHGVSYDRDEAWADYRQCSLGMFGYAVVIAGTLDPSNERGVQFMTALVERACAAFADLELADLL